MNQPRRRDGAQYQLTQHCAAHVERTPLPTPTHGLAFSASYAILFYWPMARGHTALQIHHIRTAWNSSTHRSLFRAMRQPNCNSPQLGACGGRRVAPAENVTLLLLCILFELMDECKMRDVKVTRRPLQRRISSFKNKNNVTFKIWLWSSPSFGAWAWHAASCTPAWAQIEYTVVPEQLSLQTVRTKLLKIQI